MDYSHVRDVDPAVADALDGEYDPREIEPKWQDSGSR